VSYEGYSQLLCDRGHQWTEGCGQVDEYSTCPVCGGPPVWENCVDQTNGIFEDGIRIDGYVELEKVKEDKCEHCGHVKEVCYKIPDNVTRQL